jgi:hypothetical protein
MDGLLFLASVLAIGLVMWWMLRNDTPDPRAVTKGLFAMGTRRGRKKRHPPQ